jgi:catechol 2,3-dioxygenase-like lactoylglutathione lyase family enzyme
MFQVGLVPSNLEASLAFYRDEVGLEPMMVVPLAGGRKLHLFSTGDGAVVKLLERRPDEPAPTPGGGGAFGDQIGIRWLTFDVTDLGADRAD